MPPKNSLKKYRKRRSFKHTPEPKKTVRRVTHTIRKKVRAVTNIKFKGPIFVVQKHDATNLHYDFRFEYKGVLKSWAVPKGISSRLGDRSLAIPTEDHPIAYAYFEGVIPEGHYGAGPVMVWDIGTFQNMKVASLEECLKMGRIELWLEGTKLKGGYALIRTERSETSEKYWLLLKTRDRYANKPFKNKPLSAISGRTLKEIEAEHGEK